MFKKLFNNPWFVAAIGACAMIYFGIAVVAPLVMDDEEAVAYEDSDMPSAIDDITEYFDRESYADEGAAIAASGTAAAGQSERAKIGWLDDVERDPFAGTFLDRPSVDDDALPHIGALFVGEGIRAAVVNNRLVREGDSVGQFYVDAIEEERVLLRRAGISYTVEPEA